MKMWIGNLDGIRKGLVISRSKERARKIVRASRAEFDGYWAVQAVVDTTKKPDTLYTQPGVASYVGEPPPWTEGLCEMSKRATSHDASAPLGRRS